MYEWLLEALVPDAVVITANRRLARRLRLAYADLQVAAGRQAWPTPPIHAFDDWCRTQLDEAVHPGEFPVALDGFSAGIIWEWSLNQQEHIELPAMGGVIRQARDAWQRIAEWNVPLDVMRKAARSADENLFAEAAGSYALRLRDGHWVDRSGLPQFAAGLLASAGVAAPKAVTLLGFDRYSPAVESIVDALRAQGCEVRPTPEPVLAADLRVAACTDADAEMRTAGAWARDILQRFPGASVAIVNPSLHTGADRAARLVREGLAPGWQYGDAEWQTTVDVSYGRSLSDYPAVASALLLLRWIHQGLGMTDLSLLLRSRSLGMQSTAGRSRLEVLLRRLPDRSWTPEGLLRTLHDRDGTPDALNWLEGLKACIQLRTEAVRDASPAQWAGHIDAYLAAWNWPGDATLESDEFQLVNRWRDLLNELAATARVTPQVSLREAINRLHARAAEVVFQPEGNAGVVTLLGTLEAAGMQFDHLWVSGLHAGQWPTAGSPSALLSRQLQKEYGMPDATPADNLAFSRRVLLRLASSATHVVFSWPENDGESELAASSLLEALPCASYAGPGDPEWHALSYCGTGTIEPGSSDPVPEVDADERVRGGAYTVQRQATEPFSAFVYGRLGVRNPDSIETGVSASLRGNIIHGALCELFAGCPSQGEIARWDSAEIGRRLGSAIDTVIAPHLYQSGPTLERLLGLERTRLFHLLREFIGMEVARPEFNIAGVESAVAYQSCGVRLDLRVDRLDRLADGTLLVIDYKTGAPKNLLNRQGDPLDLQLVVYADALDQAIGGLALINLDRREISYKGTGGSVDWDAARQDEWSERLAAWRAAVHHALRAFAAGDVRIDLRKSSADSRPLSILSRVEEHKRAL